MVFSHTSLEVGIETVLLLGSLKRAIFFFGLILKVVEYSKGVSLEGLESKGEQELKKSKKFLESAKDGISSKCPIYTSLGELPVERSPWKFKKTK